jgi:hypothetical protein
MSTFNRMGTCSPLMSMATSLAWNRQSLTSRLAISPVTSAWVLVRNTQASSSRSPAIARRAVLLAPNRVALRLSRLAEWVTSNTVPWLLSVVPWLSMRAPSTMNMLLPLSRRESTRTSSWLSSRVTGKELLRSPWSLMTTPRSSRRPPYDQSIMSRSSMRSWLVPCTTRVSPGGSWKWPSAAMSLTAISQRAPRTALARIGKNRALTRVWRSRFISVLPANRLPSPGVARHADIRARCTSGGIPGRPEQIGARNQSAQNVGLLDSNCQSNSGPGEIDSVANSLIPLLLRGEAPAPEAPPRAALDVALPATL